MNPEKPLTSSLLILRSRVVCAGQGDIFNGLVELPLTPKTTVTNFVFGFMYHNINVIDACTYSFKASVLSIALLSLGQHILPTP